MSMPSNFRPVPEHCWSHLAHRVGVAETDMMGIVHHGSYVTLFERGRLEYMRDRGFPYRRVVDGGHHLPVVELSVRYRTPSRMDDLLVIESRLGRLGRASLRFDYVIFRKNEETGTGSPVLEGSVSLACVDEEGRPRALPADATEALLSATGSPPLLASSPYRGER